MPNVYAPYIVRIHTPDGARQVLMPVGEKLVQLGLLTRDADGSLHGPSLAAVDQMCAEHGMCDFCSDSNAPHTIIVPDFSLEGSGVAVGESTGGWAACDTCYALFKENRRADLLRRSIETLHSGRFTAGALRGLHQHFWKNYDAMVEAAGISAALVEFIEDKLPVKAAPPYTKRDHRLEVIRRLTGLATDELDAVMKGDLAYKQVSRKLAAWGRRFDQRDMGRIIEQTEAGQNRPLPAGVMPHWQQALDMRFKAMELIQMGVDQGMVQYSQAINLNEIEVVKAAAERARRDMAGFSVDLKHLRTAETYSFNAETTAAIRTGAESIPSDTTLSAVTVPNATGWFWFADPLPVVTDPDISTVTHALLWGWATIDKTPTLRFCAFVKGADGRIFPATKWMWPMPITLHEMLEYSTSAYRHLYGPGGEFAGMLDVIPEELSIKGVSELTRFFLMACVWFKQQVLVSQPGHVERHARKRYVREHKLTETPSVQVIALRKAMHEGQTPEPGTSVEGRKYTQWRWVVDGHNRLQPCGPGRADRKLIWIDAYPKGPEGAPFKPKRQRVFAVVR